MICFCSTLMSVSVRSMMTDSVVMTGTGHHPDPALVLAAATNNRSQIRQQTPGWQIQGKLYRACEYEKDWQ